MNPSAHSRAVENLAPAPSTSLPASGMATGSDRAAVARMTAGHRAAAGTLFDRYGDMLYGFARCIVRDAADADDVVTQAFAGAWQTACFYSEREGKVVGSDGILQRRGQRRTASVRE